MTDSVLYDSFERLLGDISTPAAVRQTEADPSSPVIWQQLAESGFADAMVSEAADGAGVSLADAFPLFLLCGRQALPAPLAHTMAVRAILKASGVSVPDGPITIATLPVNNSDGALECRGVPFGKVAQWVLVPHGGTADGSNDVLLATAQAERTDTGVHGSLQAHFRWNRPFADAQLIAPGAPWLELAAAITAAQMAGAMDAVLNMTVRYAGERSQFGRPIGKFQAVQQQLAVLAELATASRISAETGCRDASPCAPNPLSAAVAKARASEAARAVVSIAHAVHAAMGVTAEYDLQLFTRRLIEWSNDYGSAGYWNRRVGDAVLSTEEPNTLEFMLSTFFAATSTDQ